MIYEVCCLGQNQMSDQEYRWIWNAFGDIGNNIHEMRGQARFLELKHVLVVAKQLIENEFIPNLPIKDLQRYKALPPKIAVYLDGNAEVIQSAVKENFLNSTLQGWP
jgi:hypothetical protein